VPELNPRLLDRLDALGDRAQASVPSPPPGLLASVAANRPGARVPRAALSAAAVVVVAGAVLVALGVPTNRHRGVVAGGESRATLLSMMSRFNRVGSVDAAVAFPAGAFASQAPVYRAGDARGGTLPE